MTCITLPIAADALLPKTMRAVGLTRRPEVGGVGRTLEMLNVPAPRPRREEVVVRVEASAMHIDDIHIAQGTALGRFLGPNQVSAANPYILGSTIAGTVVKVGSQVDGLKVGDTVFSVHNATGDSGSWAEYRTVKGTALLPIPQSMNPTQSSALSLAASVAWGAIENAAVGRGARVCVVGASGGIGCVMTQMLKAIGCDVTAVCSGSNAGFVRGLGADHVIDYTRHDFGDAPANTYDVVFTWSVVVKLKTARFAF